MPTQTTLTRSSQSPPAQSRADRAHQTWTIVLAGLGVFMTALDTLVVATALPVLRTSLHTSLAGLEWTVNAYILSFACLLLTGAALGDRFGRRRMFAVGVAVFTLGSAGSALSGSVGALIAARIVQGAGAAIVFPLTLTLISEAFPAEKRGAAIGLWGAIAGLAVAGGPVVGGAIVEGVSWHWIFWLNVPVGLVLIPLALARLRESHGPQAQLDLPGVALAAAGVLGVAWALVRSSAVGWGSGEVLATLLAGVALIGAFLAWERRAASPILPLSLFARNPAFAGANIVSFLMYGALIGTLFLMTQLLQFALGDSPLSAGVRLLPWTGAPMVVAPLAGALADRYGNRPFMVVGLALQAAGLGWVALAAAPGMGYTQLGIALAIAGIGISMCFPTVSNAVLASVPPAEAGVASGTNSTMRELGAVFGVALLATVFARHSVYHSPRLFIDGFTPAVWVGAGLSALGIPAALLTPGRGRAAEATAAVAQPAMALSGEPA